MCIKKKPTVQVQTATYTAICQRWYIPELGRCVMCISPGKEFAGFRIGHPPDGDFADMCGIYLSAAGRHSYQNDVLVEFADAHSGDSDIVVGALPLKPDGDEGFEIHESIQHFDGAPMNGDFLLVFEDTQDGDDGEVRQASLTITGWRYVASVEKPKPILKREWLRPCVAVQKRPATASVRRKPRK